MTETPQQKENFLTNLKNGVGEIKNEAVKTWKSMDSQDALKAFLGGQGLSILGIVINVAGRATDLWAIEGLGTTYALMGAGTMVGGYVKLMEIGIKDSLGKRQSKNQDQ